MSLSVMKERPCEVTQREAYEQFQRTLVAAAEGEPAPATTTGATAEGGPGTGKSPAKAVKKARPSAVKQ